MLSGGTLDHITIFRFAHIFRNSRAGGVEAYLNDLNRLLLERNRMRILQMYLAPKGQSLRTEIEPMGQGEMVWIPSFLTTPIGNGLKGHRIRAVLKRRLFPSLLISHELLLSTLGKYEVSLAVFHWISEDSKRVLRYLEKAHVPFAVVNHFHNKRLKWKMIKKQIGHAVSIGGVSNVEVPSFLEKGFVNLSDAIDPGFFQLEKANPIGREFEGFLIFFPSRITEEKGHLDAVRALGVLGRKGIKAGLVFAGRVESEGFVRRLKETMAQENIKDRVIFAGEVEAQRLRDWYAASDLVLLPSYSEGLGRVLLEAQAMKRAVVSYEVGGVSEAVRKGESGYLVRKGDIEGLARRLQELLEDKGKRSEMGERGRSFVVSEFSLPNLADRHERFYLKAMEQSVYSGREYRTQ